jgi:hypothetical protein
MTYYDNFTQLNMSYLNDLPSFWQPPTVNMSFSSFTPTWLGGFTMPLWNNLSNMFSSFNIWNAGNFSNFWNASLTPSWNVGNIFNFTPNYNYSMMDSFSFNVNKTRSSSSSSSTSKTKAEAMTTLKSFGYNETKGDTLAQKALNNANYVCNPTTKQITSKRKLQSEFTTQCARYVKMAIRDSGLGSYTNGHAYQMKSVLEKNPNFKEIPVSSVNVNDLPAGCILVFDKGTQKYSSSYGHVEITTGDGRGVSDGITRNLRTPSAIFIPV